MTRSTRIFSIPMAMLIALSACGTSAPELPPDSSSEMVNVLTSDTGDDVLKKVTTYEWDDDGAAAAGRFTWIGQDDESQATQAAALIAEYLIADHNSLAALDAGFLGLSKVPAAQLNPFLIRSYATALAPHISELVGGQQSAFDSLRAQVGDDSLALRNLLSVFVADPEAGRTAVEATHSAAEQYEIDAAAAPPDSDESVADLRAAGSLLGAAYGAVELAGSDIPTPTIGEATNDMAVRVAAILVPADPNAAKVSQYVQDGRLMSPAEVERRFSNTAMRRYFLDLQDYISGKGFGDGMSAFHDAFMARAGVPPP
jgi:hypothetical protein